MKSERRHELQHNMLAEWLVAKYAQIKPYQNAILGVAVLLLVAIAGYKWWGMYSRGRDAKAWESMDQAMNVQSGAELERVMTSQHGTPVEAWAAFRAAEAYQRSALKALFPDKEDATVADKETAAKDLEKAIGLYQTVSKTANSPVLKQLATYNLAHSLESQAAVNGKETEGKLTEAAKYYQQLLDSYEKNSDQSFKGMFADEAKKRLEDIKEQVTVKRYQELAAYNPPAPTASSTGRSPTDLGFPSDTPGSRSLGGIPEPSADPTPAFDQLPGGAAPKEPPKPGPESKTDAKSPEKAAEKNAETNGEDKPWEKTIPPPPELPAEKISEKPAPPGK